MSSKNKDHTGFSDIAYNFTRKLNLRLHKGEFKLVLESHPDYPNVNSLIETLNQTGIECQLFEVNDKKTIADLPVPFLYQTSTGVFTMVEKLSTERMKEILNEWNGVVIMAGAAPLQYQSNWRALRNSFGIARFTNINSFFIIGLLVITILAGILQQGFSSQFFLYEMFLDLGLVVCILMVQDKFGSGSYISDKICSQTNGGCRSVLFSAGSKIAGIDLLDLCVLFFFGSWVTLQFSRVFEFDMNILYWLPFVALPFCAYSIFYQGIYLKTWCALCLSVTAIVSAMSILSVSMISSRTGDLFQATTVIKCSVAFVVAAITWIILKQKLIETRDKIAETKQLLRLKRNPDIFHQALLAQKKVSIRIDDTDILFGDPQATTRITLVISPYCQYCADVFNEVSNLIELMPDKFYVVVRWIIKEKTAKEKKLRYYVKSAEIYKICKTQMNKDSSIIAVLLDWYQHFDIARLKKLFPPDGSIDADGVMNNYARWCEAEGIFFSPAIIYNDVMFPHEFKFRDLNHLLKKNQAQREHLQSSFSNSIQAV